MEWQWLLARASGFTAYLLVTMAVAFGLLLSQHWQSRSRWPRLVNDQMHQYATLLAGVFTAIHGVSVLIDPFTGFTLREMLVPFASHYRPLWMALGILAAYLGLALVVTSWLRPKIGYAWWRRLHYLTFVVWLLATLHGLGDGSDTRTPWAMAIYGVSSALVLSLTLARLLRPAGGARAVPRRGWATVAAATVLAMAGFALAGPLHPGWNKVANGGHGSGSRLMAQPAVAAGDLTAYEARLRGSVTEQGPDAQGNVTVLFHLRVRGGPYGVMTLALKGAPLSSGGVMLTSSSVLLGTQSDPSLYRGGLAALEGDAFRATLQGGSRLIAVAGRLSLSQDGTVQGILQVQPSSGGGASSNQGGDF